MYVSFLLSLGMSRSETPSPAHSSKKDQKKCVVCHSFMSELDQHPECNRCLPLSCCKGSPCPHCLPLSQDTWKKWEHQQSVKKSSSTTKGPKGESGKGGTRLGRYPQRFHLPPNLIVSRDASRRPIPQTPILTGPAWKAGTGKPQWYSRGAQFECFQPSGGAVRLHWPHGFCHRPRLWQSTGLRLC